MLVILLGPPGSGKGTQAVRVAQAKKLNHLSTGDLLREAVKHETDLGKKAKKFMDAGNLVPDELILGLIREKVGGNDGGYLFDGFPRTIPQAEGLDKMLQQIGTGIDFVIDLQVSDEEVMKRLMSRGRADDTEDVVRNRLQVYRKQTQPLQDYYQKKSLLKPVQGEGDIDEIFENILKLFQER